MSSRRSSISPLRLLGFLVWLASATGLGCSDEQSGGSCKSDADCEDGEKCNVLVERCLLTREADERFADYGSECSDAIECLHEACIGNDERRFCSATCEVDDDCATIGDDAVCVTINEDLDTCLFTCEQDTDCLDDFVCVAGDVCIPPELLADKTPDPICEELGDASVCLFHVALSCEDGVSIEHFCPDDRQLCEYDARGVGRCAEPDPQDECEYSCLAIASCGGCLSIDDACLSVDECTAGCRDLELEVTDSCIGTLAECDLDAFISCSGANEALAEENSAAATEQDPSSSTDTGSTTSDPNSSDGEPDQPPPDAAVDQDIQRPEWCSDPIATWQEAGTYVAEFERTSGDCVPYATSYWVVAVDGNDTDVCELVDVTVDDQLCQVTEVVECNFADGTTSSEESTYGQREEGGEITGTTVLTASNCSATHEFTLTPSSEVPAHSCTPASEWANKTYWATYALISGECQVPEPEAVMFNDELQYDSTLNGSAGGETGSSAQCTVTSSTATDGQCRAQLTETCTYETCGDPSEGSEACPVGTPPAFTISSIYEQNLDGGVILGQRTLSSADCAATLSVELYPLSLSL